MILGICEAKLVGGYFLWFVTKSFLVTVLLQPASYVPFAITVVVQCNNFSDYTIAKVSEKIFIKELLGSLIRGWVNVQSNRISEGRSISRITSLQIKACCSRSCYLTELSRCKVT